jgi:membrane-associated phospholipid phosphatase
VNASLHLAAAPLHGSTQDYVAAALLTSAVLASSGWDADVRHNVAYRQDEWASVVSNAGKNWGSPYVAFGTAGMLYGYGLVEDNSRVRTVGAEIVEAFCLAGAGAQILKHAVGRARPYAETGSHHFNGVAFNNRDESFISGDATTAFAFSSVLAAEIKSLPATAALYALASATAFQRLHRDKHWLSDVVGGAVWGSAVGWGVVHWNKKIGTLPVQAAVTPQGVSCSVNLP